MRSIGIYGGSFNPVHFGHVGLAKWVIENTDLDELWLLVSPNNPLKPAGILAPEEERLAAVREAVKDIPGVKASDFEFGLPRPSYTANTLRELQKKYPDISQELVFKIFEANFIDNKIIADIDTLSDIANKLGLDEEEIRNILESDSYNFEVQIEEEDAIVMGVEGIPLYFLNHSEEQLIVPGAFEKEDFKIAIEDLINGEIESKSYI